MPSSRVANGALAIADGAASFGMQGGEVAEVLMFEAATGVTRDAAIFSARGGIASIKIDENSTTSRRCLSATCHGGIAIDFYLDAVPASSNFRIACFITGGTNNYVDLCWRTSDSKLVWKERNTAAGEGTEVGTAGGTALSAATWYRLWVYVNEKGPSSARVLDFTVRVEGVLEATYLDVAAGTQGVTSVAVGNTSGVAIPASGHFDNVAFFPGSRTTGAFGPCATEADDIEVVILGTHSSGVTMSGAGTDTAWTGTYTDVDEAVPNGSGTTDSDYIASPEPQTAAAAETETMNTITLPSGYAHVCGLAMAAWHRNSGGGKWIATHTFKTRIAGNVRSPTWGDTDPGTSYKRTSPSLLLSADGTRRLEPADFASAFECGMSKAANASEAAVWRVSAIQCEVGYIKALPVLL